jgi:purine catabolism regulator
LSVHLATASQQLQDAPPLTLGDVIRDEELGLELIAGDDAALATPVTGAHSIEVDHPERWLDHGWIMLTTGVALSTDDADQRARVRELRAAGVAALGFGVGLVHDDVPSALLDEARELGLPLFVVPLRTPFREVISTVYRCVLSEEIRSFSRFEAMQRFLMDSLGQESPREIVIERLAALLHCTASIVLCNGDVLVSSEPGIELRLPGAIHDRGGPVVTFTAGGVDGYAFPLATSSEARMGWLVLSTPDGTPFHPLAKAAGRAAVVLLVAMRRFEEAQEARDAAARRTALDALLDADDRHEARAAAARALSWGVDLEAGAKVLAVATWQPNGLADGASETLRRIECRFALRGLPMVATQREDHVAVLSNASLDEARLLELIGAAEGGLRVGVGRRIDHPLDVKTSWSDALLAVGDRSPARARSWIVHYEDLDLGTVLVNAISEDRIAPKLMGLVDSLERNPMALETLECYLRNDLDVGRTARALALHPNSVRYRLSKAEDIVGAPLRRASTLVALHLALELGSWRSEAERADAPSPRRRHGASKRM